MHVLILIYNILLYSHSDFIFLFPSLHSSPIQPAWAIQNRQILKDAFLEIRDDVRTASIATLMCMAFMFTGASAGNFEDIDWILSSADAIRCDSEALDDSKMMQYSMKNFIHLAWAWYSDDNTTLFERWENISVTANKLFPKTIL